MAGEVVRYGGEAILWTAHAEGYLDRRGFSKAEVEEAIKSNDWVLNSRGRFECRKDYSFEQIWNRAFYKTKQVRPVFVKEGSTIVVITVYTYYF